MGFSNIVWGFVIICYRLWSCFALFCLVGSYCTRFDSCYVVTGRAVEEPASASFSFCLLNWLRLSTASLCS